MSPAFQKGDLIQFFSDRDDASLRLLAGTSVLVIGFVPKPGLSWTHGNYIVLYRNRLTEFEAGWTERNLVKLNK
jgi:hypothetical protein